MTFSKQQDMAVASRLAAAAPLRRSLPARAALLSTQSGGGGHGDKRRGKMVAVAERIRLAYEYLSQRRLPESVRAPSRDPVRSELDLSNVVEQRIIESMGDGQFENLPGKGKPLKLEENPHCDPDEIVLNRVLAKNGFAPRWVELHKDIRHRTLQWRLTLRLAVEKGHQSDSTRADAIKEGLKSELKDINRQVLDYNILAPFGHQMLSHNFEKELQLVEQQFAGSECPARIPSFVKGGDGSCEQSSPVT